MIKMHIGVVGLGYWGPNIVRNLLSLPNITVSGCDIDHKILARISKQYPSLRLTKQIETFFTDKTLDAIIIATPPHTHYALAKKSLLANKHVLLEKPMTSSSRQAKKLISIAKKQKKILMVGHTFVYAESVNLIKKFLDKKQLGKIYYFDSSRINLGLIQKNINVVWDLATHDLAILDYLFSEKPISLRAFASSHITKNQYEIAHIFLTYLSGMTAHITTSWLSPVKIRSISIAGAKKMIVYNDLEPSEKIRIYDRGIDLQNQEVTPFAPLYRNGDILIPHIAQKEALKNELTHFLSCIRNNKTPITDGACGLRIIEILEHIDKAILSGKKIILSSSS